MFKKFLLAWDKITKRQRFVIVSAFLSLGLLSIQLEDINWRYTAVAGLGVVAYFLSAWDLSEGLNGIEWLTVLSLPALFTAGVGLFYFLLPDKWSVRIPVVVLYTIGSYSLLLTENIFSVAAIRTIQLLRSAQAVGFLLTLATSFFLYDTILVYRLEPWLNFLLAAVVSFPLALQAFWYVRLEEQISRQVWFYSGMAALVLGQAALAFSFWPVSVTVGSLALTTVDYLVLSLVQHQFSERLFKNTIREYLFTGTAILLIIFLTTRWSG